MRWTYSRGHWRSHNDAPYSERAALAKQRIRKWELQRRWTIHKDKLGPIPEQWMDVGSPPSGISLVNEVLIAEYLSPVVNMLNTPSPLMRYLA